MLIFKKMTIVKKLQVQLQKVTSCAQEHIAKTAVKVHSPTSSRFSYKHLNFFIPECHCGYP